MLAQNTVNTIDLTPIKLTRPSKVKVNVKKLNQPVFDQKLKSQN